MPYKNDLNKNKEGNKNQNSSYPIPDRKDSIVVELPNQKTGDSRITENNNRYYRDSAKEIIKLAVDTENEKKKK